MLVLMIYVLVDETLVVNLGVSLVLEILVRERGGREMDWHGLLALWVALY